MDRDDLRRLSKDELIDLVLRLQRPAKTSRTSSKPPSLDRKERREKAKPGGAKHGYEGKARVMTDRFDRLFEHRPGVCPCCQAALLADLSGEPISEHETVELPEVRPVVEGIIGWLSSVHPVASELSHRSRKRRKAHRSDRGCSRLRLI